MQTRRPYSSQDLDGMIMDLDYGLSHAGLRVVRIKKTGDAECMLEAKCLLNGVTSADVQAAIEHAWLAHGAFDCEAHALTQNEHQTLLDFVTWWQGSGGSYVTGLIAVDLSRPTDQIATQGDATAPLIPGYHVLTIRHLREQHGLGRIVQNQWHGE